MRQMGCPVRLSGVDFRVDADALIGHLERAGHVLLGEGADVRPDDVRNILTLAA